MPVERREISVSQFAELLGVEAERVIGVERKGSTMVLLLEPEATNGDDVGSNPATERGYNRGQKERQHEEDHGLDGDGQEKHALQLLRGGHV
jgi:hypothetical protein